MLPTTLFFIALTYHPSFYVALTTFNYRDFVMAALQLVCILNIHLWRIEIDILS